jgi:hypothetical protein
MGRGELHTRFWWGKLKERNHLEHLILEGSIIYLQEVGWGGMGWIDLVQERDR